MDSANHLDRNISEGDGLRSRTLTAVLKIIFSNQFAMQAVCFITNGLLQ